MNAIILNGSPKSNGNTSTMVATVTRALKDGDANVIVHQISQKDISFCKGCKSCEVDGDCVIEDDIGMIVADIMNADLVIVTSPSYWGDITAQLKMFIDRCTPYCNQNTARKFKSRSNAIGIAIVVRAGMRQEENLHLVETIRHFLGHLDIPLVDYFTVERVGKISDLEARPEILQDAYTFGQKLITLTDEERRAAIYPIILTDYNPEWVTWYADEKIKIEQSIGAESIARMQHYGSTSIPDMFAKPTVDILLEIPENVDVEGIKERMIATGYICLDENGLTMETPPPHLMFIGGYMPTGFAERVFHIHVQYYSDNEPNEIVFRDYLIAHPEIAKEYADLKRSLWKDFEHNRDGYTEAKGEFVWEVTRKAREENEK